MSNDITLEVINKIETPDFSAKINRPEVNLLIGMLKKLAITKEEINPTALEEQQKQQAYLQLLPQSVRDVIAEIKTAVADPAKDIDAMVKKIIDRDFRLQEMEDEKQNPKEKKRKDGLRKEFATEFKRVVEGLRSTGKVEHQALKGALNAYGEDGKDDKDDGELAVYKKDGLSNRILNQGYTFFVLRDEHGVPVALASGNANKLASEAAKTKAIENGDFIDDSQFRLLNVAVPEQNQGQGYGKQLIEAVRKYTEKQGYKKIVMPLSLPALMKENPVIYAQMLQDLDMKVPFINDHPHDPLSIEFRMSPERKKSKALQETLRRDGNQDHLLDR